MGLGDFLSNTASGLGQSFFPTDPSLQVDPQYAQGLRNNSLIQLGLGIMAAPYNFRGMGAGLLDAMNGAQGAYGQAMNNAYRNTLLRQQADFQQQERGIQLKQQDIQTRALQRQERESSAITAQRVLSGLQNSADPMAQWNLVKTDPSVQQALSDLKIESPYTGPMADPGQFEAFKQQLANAAGVEAPLPKPMVVAPGASVVGVSPTGQASTLVPGQPEVTYQDVGDKKVPVDKFGHVVPGLPALQKGLPPGLGADPTSVEQTAQMIARGEIPMISGFALKTPWGQQVVARVGQINPNYSAADYTVGAATRTAFAKGQQGNTVRSLNVAVQHLSVLGNLADALNNGDVQLINRAANAWKTQTGQPAPTSFEAAKKIVADEVVKAIVGTGGAAGDREDAARTINAASSPAQLRQVIATYQRLMGGQLAGLRRQYEQNTRRNDFDQFLAPETKSVLGGIAQQGPVRIGSDADYAALPSGAEFIAPDGSHRRKP